jgi:hypothetical protein
LEITEWLAIVGAITGTVSTLLHLRNWWYDRPHASVKVAYALTANGFAGPQHLVSLSVVNKGKRRIQLTGAGFEIEAGRTLWFTRCPPGLPDSGFPKWLDPGSQHTVYFSLPELVKTIVTDNHGLPPRYAWFKDATDKTYRKSVNVRAFRSWVEMAGRFSQ